ncbi:MAG: hypothetical protein MSG64_19450 [Pyrinomonadaceae bacterium MAG19_C2-C3]|nr:hypothetical protein [Pyrinomonadaceae bacterium MAG19_C2-C3]
MPTALQFCPRRASLEIFHPAKHLLNFNPVRIATVLANQKTLMTCTVPRIASGGNDKSYTGHDAWRLRCARANLP